MENDYILKKLEQDCFRDISKYIYIYFLSSSCIVRKWNLELDDVHRESIFHDQFKFHDYYNSVFRNNFIE